MARFLGWHSELQPAKLLWESDGQQYRLDGQLKYKRDESSLSFLGSAVEYSPYLLLPTQLSLKVNK